MEYRDEVYVRFEVCCHKADRRRSCEYFQMAWGGDDLENRMQGSFS